MAYDFDLFVIGGGSGGVRCARIAAGYGARVGVAEDGRWGGTCVNIGCVPKKIMVQAAEYGAWAEESAGFGWDVAPGRFDFAKLVAARDAEVQRLSAIYKRLLDGAGCTVFEARASFVDAHTLQVGERTITADKILIATGGQPVRPEIPGAELGMISDDVFTLQAAPKRLVVVGSGYIALEFAGVFQGLGSQVELFYRADLPLRHFDGDVRADLALALDAAGIHQHAGDLPVKLEKMGDEIVLHSQKGLEMRCDAVLFATGRVPNTRGLGLEKAGVTVNKGGAVVVDEDHRTSQGNIYALGDVIDRMNLTPVATAAGHALADTLFGNRPRRISYENVATAVFTQPPIATVGLTEEQAAAERVVDVYVSRFTPMRHTISKRARKTLMKLIVDQATQKVVGAHMLGDDAPEIMQGIAVAINMGATKADFDRTIGIHPTAAEEFVTLRTRTREAGPQPAKVAAQA